MFSSDAAADAGEDEALVLIRPETSPEDVPGTAVAVGIVTATGGLVSHAAVVARGWGLPAVVGADTLLVDDGGARTVDGTVIGPGDVVTLDGTTGDIWLGGDPATAGPVDDHVTISAALPELLRLEEWARTHHGAAGRAGCCGSGPVRGAARRRAHPARGVRRGAPRRHHPARAAAR